MKPVKMKKEITITTEGESTTKEVFFHLKNWCILNLQEFELKVKGDKVFEYKQKNAKTNTQK